MGATGIMWILFNIFVLVLLMLDLGVFHKSNRAIGVKESLVWSGIWIVVALLFNVAVYFWSGGQKAFEFLTVYIVERSLSVDNIFVFVLIFSYFRVAQEYQYKILFWGILGALVMRAAFIVAGVALLDRFHWLIYIFGALLVYIGAKLAFEKEKEIHPEKNPIINLCKRFLPLSHHHGDGQFFLNDSGKILATPLFLVLIVIETTDVIFAVDSIPAALAISSDSFIIYSANVFAILGLRALYFALAGCMQLFRYLQYGLALVLTFVGAKMLLTEFIKIPIGLSLGFIVLVLAVAIAASLLIKQPAVQSGECNTH
jgi:tellurite resistance protein TerC